MNKAKDKHMQNIARIQLTILFTISVLILRLVFHLPWGKAFVFGFGITIVLSVLLSRLFVKRYRREGVRYILKYTYGIIFKGYGALGITIQSPGNIKEALLEILSLMQQYYKSDKFSCMWVETVGKSIKDKEEVFDYQNISLMLDKGLEFESIKNESGEGWLCYDAGKLRITIQEDDGLIEYLINKIGGGVS
ncbi:MAG: hypothetical protein V1650_01970 [Candidatus Omnitrophota bacterium]